MLTTVQRDALTRLSDFDRNYRGVLRKRILDKAVTAIDDLVMVFNQADLLPDAHRRIPPPKIQSLVNAYFEAFKVDTSYSDPKKVIQLINENVVLHRTNARLQEEIGDLVYQIEHFKYLAQHSTEMLEMERAKTTADGDAGMP